MCFFLLARQKTDENLWTNFGNINIKVKLKCYSEQKKNFQNINDYVSWLSSQKKMGGHKNIWLKFQKKKVLNALKRKKQKTLKKKFGMDTYLSSTEQRWAAVPTWSVRRLFCTFPIAEVKCAIAPFVFDVGKNGSRFGLRVS